MSRSFFPPVRPCVYVTRVHRTQACACARVCEAPTDFSAAYSRAADVADIADAADAADVADVADDAGCSCDDI